MFRRVSLAMTIALMAMLVLAFSASARADWMDVPDPDWVAALDSSSWQVFHWDVESLNEADASWDSTELVPTVAPLGYDYISEFTIIQAQLGGVLWLDVTAVIGDTFGGGTKPSLPFDIINEKFEEAGVLTVDMLHDVVASGQVHTSMTNASFGTYANTPITGFRGAAVTAVNLVPEPGSVVMLISGCLCAVGLVWRRRRRS